MKYLLLLGTLLSFAAYGSPFAAPLLSIEASRSGGQKVLFIRPTTTFAHSYVLLDSSIYGQAVALEHPSPDLWIYKIPQDATGFQTIAFKISLANSRKVDQISASIRAVDSEILSLQDAIAHTSDSGELAALHSALNEKTRLRQRLLADLANLKNFIGNQTYSFSANF